MINYIFEGDIFSLDGISAYAHGCNCAGAMGKGIALSFKNKYPQMYLEYKELCRQGKFKPGDIFVYKSPDGFCVYNLGTQANWWSKATLENISTSIKNMMKSAKETGVQNIAMPAIGAGLGGLEWNDVKQVIEEISKDYPDICLHIVERFKKKQLERNSYGKNF